MKVKKVLFFISVCLSISVGGCKRNNETDDLPILTLSPTSTSTPTPSPTFVPVVIPTPSYAVSPSPTPLSLENAGLTKIKEIQLQ